MDGLASVDQVWSNSSTGTVNGYPALGQSGHTWQPYSASSHSHSRLHSLQIPGQARQYSSTSSTTEQIGSSNSNSSSGNSSNESSDYSFEPLDAATRDYGHRRHHAPAAGHADLAPPPPLLAASSNSSRRLTSTAHSPDALQTAAPLRVSLSSSSSGGSSSSTGTRLSQRQSGSGSFLTATASQLLSSLGMLSGFSLLGISPSSSSSSNRGPPSGRHGRPATSTNRLRVRSMLLVRSPAFLLDIDSGDSYDDLLALDQFNVKRAVRPCVLAALPSRTPTEQDALRAAQCFICLEQWTPAAAAAAAAAAVGPDNQADTSLQENGGKTTTTASAACCRCCSSRSCQRLPVSAAVAAAARSTAVGSYRRDSIPVHDQGGRHIIMRDEGYIAGPDDTGVMQQQQQQRQDELSCWDSWGAAMFWQPQQQQQQQASTPSSSATAAAGSSTTLGSSEMVRNPLSRSCSSRSSYDSAVSDGAGVCAAPVAVLQLPCGHEYCALCIGTWLAEHATCPICRWTFPDAQTQLINLHK